MNDRFERFFKNLIPFLILGISLAFVVGLFIMFSYVLIWGILIGGVFWVISLIKNFLFPGSPPPKSVGKAKGRIIEHNDKD